MVLNEYEMNFFYILALTILRYKSYILFNLTKFVYYPINLLIINPIYDYFYSHEFRFILDEFVKVITFNNFLISVLICVFIIAFVKDFYKKHFRWTGIGMFQKLSILWVQRKQITIFIITMVIITFPIRILIRGFILCLLCKHSLLVMILAMPFTCFFSNILKKYFFNMPIRKEDYFLFNDYVIKNVNLYNIFTIFVIQFLYKTYMYYYICGIIIGIIIIFFILTENNKRFSPYLFLEANTNLSFSFICCLAVALQQAADTGFNLGVGEKKLTIENTSFPSKQYSGQSLLIKPETEKMTSREITAKQSILEGVENFPLLNMTNQQIENIKTKFEKELLDTKDIAFNGLDLTIQPHSLYYKPEKNLVGLFSYIKAHKILIANLYNTNKYQGWSIFNIYEATEKFDSNKLLQELGNMINFYSLSSLTDFRHVIVLTDFEFTGANNLIKIPNYINYGHKDPIQVITTEDYYALGESIDNYSNNYEKRNEAMVAAQYKVQNNWSRDYIAKDIFSMYIHSISAAFAKNFERPGPELDPEEYKLYFSCRHKDKPFLIHKPSIAVEGGIADYMNNDIMNDGRNTFYARAKRVIGSNINNGKESYLYGLNIDEARMEFLYLEKNTTDDKYSIYSFIDITNYGRISISTMENTIMLKQTYNIFNSTDQETLRKFLTLANQ